MKAAEPYTVTPTQFAQVVKRTAFGCSQLPKLRDPAVVTGRPWSLALVDEKRR
ncbi:hypothetical protein ACIQPR_01200 [Streptomyces sp. NPDC091280]|uniref:hypothetical protein n=1 Tax=Streptomyces sp. NPDC091280 TaxID=3365984 RepID=UPI0038181453